MSHFFAAVRFAFVAAALWQVNGNLANITDAADNATLTAATIAAGGLPVAGITTAALGLHSRAQFHDVLDFAFVLVVSGGVVAGAITVAGWVL